MTTNEILSAFMKGNEIASISEKQRSWLLSQAKKDGIVIRNDGFSDSLILVDCHYKISQCRSRVGGVGGVIGTRAIQGRYNIRKMYTVKFDSTGLTVVCESHDMKHYQSEGHPFTVINQLFA